MRQVSVDLQRVLDSVAAEPSPAPKPVSRATRRPVSRSSRIQNMAGFGPMSRITTTFGEVHAHVLRQGDIIRTNNGKFLPIKAVDQLRLDEDFLARYPSALPIRIRANALGPGLPKADMVMAPYQMLRVGPPNLQQPPVPAIKFLDRPFVDRVQEKMITYTRISLGQPCFVSCEGIWAELPV